MRAGGGLRQYQEFKPLYWLFIATVDLPAFPRRMRNTKLEYNRARRKRRHGLDWMDWFLFRIEQLTRFSAIVRSTPVIMNRFGKIKTDPFKAVRFEVQSYALDPTIADDLENLCFSPVVTKCRFQRFEPSDTRVFGESH